MILMIKNYLHGIVLMWLCNEYYYVSKHDTPTNGNILLECKEFINVQYGESLSNI